MPEPAAVCDRCGFIILPKQSYVAILRHVEHMGR